MATLQTFEQFPELPGELRNKIYRLLPLINRRTLHVDILADWDNRKPTEIVNPLLGLERQLHSRPAPLPPFLQVSHEMRAELRPDYKILLSACPKALVNVNADVIHICAGALRLMEDSRERGSTETIDQLSNTITIQTLSMVWVTESDVDHLLSIASANEPLRRSLMELHLSVYPAHLERWVTYVKNHHGKKWEGMMVTQGPVPLSLEQARAQWKEKKARNAAFTNLENAPLDRERVPYLDIGLVKATADNLKVNIDTVIASI
jgi:hypothetical protein